MKIWSLDGILRPEGRRGGGDKWLTGSDDDDGAEEAQLGVVEAEAVETLGEFKHRIHEEARVGRIMQSVPPQELPVEAQHRVALIPPNSNRWRLAYMGLVTAAGHRWRRRRAGQGLGAAPGYLRVEHGGEADEEHFEDAGFEEGDFIVLGEEGETGETFGEFHHVADGRQEALREVLQELRLLAAGWRWRGVQRARLSIKQHLPIEDRAH